MGKLVNAGSHMRSPTSVVNSVELVLKRIDAAGSGSEQTDPWQATAGHQTGKARGQDDQAWQTASPACDLEGCGLKFSVRDATTRQPKAEVGLW